MSNLTQGETFRTYPYIPSFWYDQADQLRWTLTVSQSAVLSAVLGIIVSYVSGRLLTIFYTAIYISLLHRKTRTLIDDQVVTIATNTEDPFKLLSFLSRFALAAKRRAFVSTVFRVLFLIALVYFAIQPVIVFFLGDLIVNGPVPISPGTCGGPNIANTSSNTSQSSEDLGYFLQHRTILVNRATTQFETCTDGGSKITCPGPAGQTFSWDVVESEPGHCWFGPEYCFNGSRTISQRATLVPSDLGTIRNSPLSVTVMAECSHVNNSQFVKEKFDPSWNASFFAYQYGTSDLYSQFPLYENDTFVVYFIEDLDFAYRFDFQTYNLNPDPLPWNPRAFLVDNLANPFMTDNTTANSTLYLLFNRIFSISSYFQNEDPFYLTVADPNPSESYLYAPARIASTMACRDRYELQIKPQDGSGNDTWIATGQWSYVSDQWLNYGPEYDGMGPDMQLFELGMSPSIFEIVFQSMAGNILNAQQTASGAIQFGNPQNISTRTEVTRWFGTAMLTALNMAEMYTSGTDNDWGLGISQFPDQYWFCDKTLRTDPLYVSVYVHTLLLILFGVALVELMAHFLHPLLLLIHTLAPKSPTAQRIYQASITKNLHNLLQLYRSAVEATSGQRFSDISEEMPIFKGPGAGIAPRYGLRLHDDKESELTDGNEESTGSLLSESKAINESNVYDKIGHSYTV